MLLISCQKDLYFWRLLHILIQSVLKQQAFTQEPTKNLAPWWALNGQFSLLGTPI